MGKKELPKLVRDTREHNNKGYMWRATSQISGTIEKKLDVGDYSVVGFEDIIAIERKGCASELINNMMSADKDRFHATLEKLSKYPYKWIVCDFNFGELQSAIKYIPKHKHKYFTMDKINGAIASIMARYGIPIIFCGAPHTVVYKNGTSKTYHRGKDLTKKLLLKAHKYYEKAITNSK